MTYRSALGWAVEIERAAGQSDTPAMEMFFDLLEEFCAEHYGTTRGPVWPRPVWSLRVGTGLVVADERVV